MVIFTYFMYSIFVVQVRRIPITKTGYQILLDKRDNLLVQRPDAVKTLKAARELGDLSENGLYRGARSRLSSIDSQLRRLNMQIKLSNIVEPKSDSEVQIGSKVTVLENGAKKIYLLVGELEADPKEGKVSTRSPIGSNLMRKRVSDKVQIRTPKGSLELLITAVTH